LPCPSLQSACLWEARGTPGRARRWSRSAALRSRYRCPYRAQGLPDAVRGEWSPTWATPPAQLALTLRAVGRVAPGTYPLTITAQGGGRSHAVPLLLVVESPTATPSPTSTPLLTSRDLTGFPKPVRSASSPPPLPPARPWQLALGIGLAGGGALLLALWLVARRRGRRPIWTREPAWKHPLWGVLLALVALVGLLVIWRYVRDRQVAWETYQSRIPRGVHVAVPTDSVASPPSATPGAGSVYVGDIDVSGMTVDEMRQAVETRAVAPYLRQIRVRYGEHTATLDTADLGPHTNLDEIVAQAVALSAGEDTPAAFGQFLVRNPEPVDAHLPLTCTFDYELLVSWVEARVAEVAAPLVERVFDPQTLTYTRGQPGVRLDVDEALRRLEAAVSNPSVDEVELPLVVTQPRLWGEDEIALALSLAAQRWSRAPVPASSRAVTLTFDAGRWLGPEAPASAWQPTRTMTGYLFIPGQMGWTLDVPAAARVMRAAVESDAPQATARVFTDVVPPPLTLTDVKPLLLEIAGHFDGFTGFYVQDLASGDEIRHNTHVTTSGMSMLKVAIMVTAYRTVRRPFSPGLQDAMAGMIAYSINEKSNYVILQIGEGDFALGLERVNGTLDALGMHQTYIRGPYRTEEGPYYPQIDAPTRPPVSIPPEERIDLWPDDVMQTSLSDQALLFEALYRGAQGKGCLLEAFPELSPADCQEMLDLLKTNPVRFLVGAGFPEEVPLAHKHGYGGGQYTDERMDVGIVWPPEGRPYLVGLYQWDKVSWIHWLRVWPQQIELSTTLYNYFTMPEPLPAPDKPTA